MLDKTQLEPKLRSSRRHPEGLLRCKRIIRREDREPYQCPRAARRGFAVCGMHGVGFAAREARGERQSVRSKLLHGYRARPDTIAAVIEERPTLRLIADDYRRNPMRLFDHREILAMVRALADHLLDTSDLSKPDQVMRAFNALCRVTELRMRIVSSETQTAPVTPAELDHLLDAVLRTLKSFVPADQLDAAFQFLRMQVFPERSK